MRKYIVFLGMLVVAVGAGAWQTKQKTFTLTTTSSLTVKLGIGLVATCDASGLNCQLDLDDAIISMYSVAPPTSWPPPAGWCRSSGQLASDGQFLYTCYGAGGTLAPRRAMLQP